MTETLQISPEELFFLGKQMRAKYIDYDYVRLMRDIQQHYSLHEKEIMAGLADKQILLEDFSGMVELDRDLEEMLTPVFFGNFESEVKIYEPEKGAEVEWCKFHFQEKKATQVWIKGNSLFLSSNGLDGLRALEEKIIPVTYQGKSIRISMEELNRSKPDRVLQLKNTVIGKRSAGSQLLEQNGIWYIGKSEGTAEGLDRTALKKWLSYMTEGV